MNYFNNLTQLDNPLNFVKTTLRSQLLIDHPFKQDCIRINIQLELEIVGIQTLDLESGGRYLFLRLTDGDTELEGTVSPEHYDIKMNRLVIGDTVEITGVVSSQLHGGTRLAITRIKFST